MLQNYVIILNFAILGQKKFRNNVIYSNICIKINNRTNFG